MADIRTEELSHIYSKGTPFEKTALTGINLHIGQGEMIGLIGHTGSGKSSLIQHLNALLQPTDGRVTIDGVDINSSKAARRDVRFRVGLVFQYPEYQLFEETVFQDIAFGPRNMKLSEQEIKNRVLEAADFAGVEERLFERSPLELSGGQKRRIAIAGVIAMRPEVLILDEPTAGLDPEGSRMILNNIARYREASGATVMIVSHNMDDMARIAERLVVLANGQIVMDGAPAEIFAQPETLKGLGLDIPAATELALALRKKGIPLQGTIFTHEQLKAAVLEAGRALSC
jgi:energy-coupling factor transport system ATP-binding protein